MDRLNTLLVSESGRPGFQPGRSCFRAHTLFLLLLACLAARPVDAQSVLASSEPPFEPARPAGSPPPVPARPGGTVQPPPFRWGPLAARPHAHYRFLYGDGLRASSGELASSYIDRWTAAMRLELGSRWWIDYAPSWVYYSSEAFRDTVEHAIDFNGQLAPAGWFLQLTGRYRATDSPQVETGRQTRQQVSTTTFAGTRPIAPNLLFTINAEQRLTFVEAFPDTFEWSVSPGVQHFLTSDLQTGLALDTGYVLVYRASDMGFVRPLARMSWRASPRMQFELQAGVESRQFLGARGSTLSTPHYRGAVRYEPFTTTSLSLALARSVAASYFADQAAELTVGTIGFDQRLLTHFRLSFRASFQEVAYIRGEDPGGPQRQDELRSYDVRLTTTLFRRAEVAAFFQSTHNASNVGDFDFESEQIGFEIGYRY